MLLASVYFFWEWFISRIHPCKWVPRSAPRNIHTPPKQMNDLVMRRCLSNFHVKCQLKHTNSIKCLNPRSKALGILRVRVLFLCWCSLAEICTGEIKQSQLTFSLLNLVLSVKLRLKIAFTYGPIDWFSIMHTCWPK